MEDKSEQSLAKITELVHARLQQKLFKAIDQAALKGAIRRMELQPFPIKLKDVVVEGDIVQVTLEVVGRFEFNPRQEKEPS